MLSVNPDPGRDELPDGCGKTCPALAVDRILSASHIDNDDQQELEHDRQYQDRPGKPRAGAPTAMMTRMMAIPTIRKGAWSFMDFHLNFDGASNTSNGSTQS